MRRIIELEWREEREEVEEESPSTEDTGWIRHGNK